MRKITIIMLGILSIIMFSCDKETASGVPYNQMDSSANFKKIRLNTSSLQKADKAIDELGLDRNKLTLYFDGGDNSNNCYFVIVKK